MSVSSVKVVMHFDEIRKRLEKLAKSHVEVGVIGNSKQAEVLAYAEFGTRTIPARHALTRPVNEHQKEYFDRLGEICSEVGRGSDGDKLLGRLGLKGVADVRKFIKDGGASPENAASTIAQKGSSTPVIDTGSLLQSLQHRVVTE